MQFVVILILSLFCLAGATTFHALSELSGAQQLTFTAQYPDALVAPTLVSLTYPLTYDASAATPADFVITGTASSTGNNTLQSATLTFTSGSDSISIFVVIIGGTLTTANNYPQFSKTASYSVSVTLTTSVLRTYQATLPSGFPDVAATAFVPQTLVNFNLVSPQTGGCNSVGCTGTINGSVTLTPARPNTYWSTILQSSVAASGTFLIVDSTVSVNGTSNFNTDSVEGLRFVVGAMQNGVLVHHEIQSIPSQTVVMQNTDYAVSGQISQSQYVTYHNQLGTVRLTSGGSDTTAPTCTSASVSPTTLVTTGSGFQGFTTTVTCTDETGGSGLLTSGYILSTQVTSGPTPFSNIVSDHSLIPGHVSGVVNIIGVYAFDNSGNAALYGSCGGLTGWDSLCGTAGGSSGAVTKGASFIVVLGVLMVAVFGL